MRITTHRHKNKQMTQPMGYPRHIPQKRILLLPVHIKGRRHYRGIKRGTTSRRAPSRRVRSVEVEGSHRYRSGPEESTSRSRQGCRFTELERQKTCAAAGLALCIMHLLHCAIEAASVPKLPQHSILDAMTLADVHGGALLWGQGSSPVYGGSRHDTCNVSVFLSEQDRA